MSVQDEWNKIEETLSGEVKKVDAKVNALTPKQKAAVYAGAAFVVVIVLYVIFH